MTFDPNSLFDVRNKIICVTGASSGLGRFSATLLSNAGAKVIGVARRQDALTDWQNETTGKTAAVAADLGDISALPGVAQKIAGPFGAPDVLVNAAGLNLRQHADNVTPESWAQTQDLNVASPFFLAQAMVPAMKANGWGRIVNFASLQSRRAFVNGIAYGASKGAVEQMTRAMAESWSAYGVNANALAPGFFPTELTQAVFNNEAMATKNAEQTCIGRNGKVEDIAGPILFLCSRASDYMTGQVMFIDGGFTAK